MKKFMKVKYIPLYVLIDVYKRQTYQMDWRNKKEAIIETEQDVLEGADILMVKPALAYLDIVRTISDRFDLPLCTYNVSGEYSMIKAAAINGWIDEKTVVMLSLIHIYSRTYEKDGKMITPRGYNI